MLQMGAANDYAHFRWRYVYLFSLLFLHINIILYWITRKFRMAKMVGFAGPKGSIYIYLSAWMSEVVPSLG